MSFLAILAAVAAIYLVLKIIQVLRELSSPPPPEAKFSVGEISERSLAYYNGRDWAKPLLLAVKGVVYDVTDAMDTYGQGKEWSVYAGRECARAMAKGSRDTKDIGSADLSDCGPEELRRLEERLEGLRARKCAEAGKIIPLRGVSPEELAASDGTDPARPILISIRGTVYDVSKGRDFYGPGGVYPFAGREVARAFAMLSTELSDCHDDLGGLAHIELENLREWEEKFNWKYPIIGTLTGKALSETAGQTAAGGGGDGAAAGGGTAAPAAPGGGAHSAQAAAAVFGR
ncbi:MAG: cytochrome b5-like heme/steroid binding domain-containing protein [Monoraphidium minutum]|nr:MAG: cytochrome b5-like heme/steroid binding domain-containing protein [Monoraphidium minutum]